MPTIAVNTAAPRTPSAAVPTLCECTAGTMELQLGEMGCGCNYWLKGRSASIAVCLDCNPTALPLAGCPWHRRGICPDLQPTACTCLRIVT